MNKEQLYQSLLQKMQTEQEEYRTWLLSQPAEEILNLSPKFSSRTELLKTFQQQALSVTEIKALLNINDLVTRLSDELNACPDKSLCEAIVSCVQSISELTELAIYQVDVTSDYDRIDNLSLESLLHKRGQNYIDCGRYNKVFSGYIPCNSWDDIYKTFRNTPPHDYNGTPLSVSDVVHIIHSSVIEPGFYFCDTNCFERIIFDPNVTSDMRNGLRAILLEPLVPARAILFSETMVRWIVGDYYENLCYFGDSSCIVANTSDRLMPNRAITGEDGAIFNIVYGAAIICNLIDGKYVSLNNTQMKYFMDKFLYPQEIAFDHNKIRIKDIKSFSPEDRLKEWNQRLFR